MNKKKIQAIITCLIIALIATYLGSLQGVIGAPMIALLIGMLIVNVVPSSKITNSFKSETSWVGKKFLNLGIILTGGTLSFKAILGTGAKALPLLIINIILAFAVSYFLGKKMGVSENSANLVGAGTSICGGTAIASTATVINAKENEIAYAMTAIFLFDVLAALLFPYLATGLDLTQNQAGFLIGAATNDMSSVTAAEDSYNTLNPGVNSDVAITVKLARTVLLIGVILFFSIREMKRTTGVHHQEANVIVNAFRVLPKFILLFLLMALLNSLGLFDFISNVITIDLVGNLIKPLSKLSIAIALAGIGFKIRFADLFSEGRKPIILGGITWLVVAISSFLFINVFAGYVG